MSLAMSGSMRFFAVLILITMANCSSAGRQDQTPAVSIQVEQRSQSDVLHFAGPINLQYDILVTNSSDQPLTLRRIELRTVGAGAYSLRNDSTPVNLAIPPGGTVSKMINAWGYARGGNLAAEEPVTLRAIAYFDGPTGSFVRMVSENITQGSR